MSWLPLVPFSEIKVPEPKAEEHVLPGYVPLGSTQDDMNETCFRMTGIPNETGILGAGWVGRSDTYDKHVGVLPKKHQHM